jgi:hypothetical protein
MLIGKNYRRKAGLFGEGDGLQAVRKQLKTGAALAAGGMGFARLHRDRPRVPHSVPNALNRAPPSVFVRKIKP